MGQVFHAAAQLAGAVIKHLGADGDDHTLMIGILQCVSARNQAEASFIREFVSGLLWIYKDSLISALGKNRKPGNTPCAGYSSIAYWRRSSLLFFSRSPIIHEGFDRQMRSGIGSCEDNMKCITKQLMLISVITTDGPSPSYVFTAGLRLLYCYMRHTPEDKTCGDFSSA